VVGRGLESGNVALRVRYEGSCLPIVASSWFFYILHWWCTVKHKSTFSSSCFFFRYLNEIGDHFLRKSNESIQLFGCDISYNAEEAVFVHSPFWDVHHSNISEITVMINNSLITDNGRGIFQFSRYVIFFCWKVCILLKCLKEKELL